nr:E415 [uncultured bacterium]
MTNSNRYTEEVERLALPLCQLLIAKRRLVLFIFALLSLWLGYQAAQLSLDPGFSKSIPTNHPYTKVYQKFAGIFGGGNTLEVAIVRKNGEIFDANFLAKLRDLTSDIRGIDGVNPAGVVSLFSPQAVFVMVDERGFRGGRIVPSDYQGTADQVKQVRENTVRSDEVGRLVGKDLTGALVRAELIERDGREIDYQRIGLELEKIRDKYEDADTSVQIIGFAKFISDIMSGVKAVVLFFSISVLVTAILLFWFLRSIRLGVVALVVALLSVVWELGIVNLLGIGIDPLSILVPFLIFSIASSHAVQMVNTWKQLVGDGLSSRVAAEGAFRRLFIPGTTALLGNAVGFGVIMFIDIPSIHDLGLVASIGVMVMIITNKLLLPVVLSYMRVPAIDAGELAHGRRKFEFQLWNIVAESATRKRAFPILLGGVAMLVAALIGRQHLIVGDVDAGAPELRADSRYNRDVLEITKRFQIGTDELTLVAVGEAESCTDFPSIYQMDRLHMDVGSHPGVQGVSSLAGVVRSRYVGNSEGFSKFFEIPRNQYTIGATLRGLELGQRLFNEDCSAMPIRFFLTDHRSETLDSVLKKIKKHVDSTIQGPMSILVGAGSAGIMAAVNEAVADAQGKMLLALYTGVGILCLMTFASFRATLCVLIPLIVVSQFSEAVMAWLGIGLKVSTLPVVALGAGVGVDYGIYLLSRLQSELRVGLRLKESYRKALSQVGGAVAFTATTMSIGVAFWIFSPLKFQADMGLLLTYMFFVNMVVAFVLLPALAVFLLKPFDKEIGPLAKEGQGLAIDRSLVDREVSAC